MSTAERVLAAENPKAALLVLAETIDALEARLDEPPADPWSKWDDHDTHVKAQQDFAQLAEVERDLTILKGALATENNAEERKILEAKVRLKEDELKGRPDYVDADKKRTKITTGDGEAIVDLPPPTEEQAKQRAGFATRFLKLQEEFGPEYVEAYVKGGPLWLYYGNRDFVNGLSASTKRAMVNDVQEHSPAEAHEMARDILKDLSSGDGAEVTIERMLGG